jgi:hypothetical protein
MSESSGPFGRFVRANLTTTGPISLKKWVFEHFEACRQFVNYAQQTGTHPDWPTVARELESLGVVNANGMPIRGKTVSKAYWREWKVRQKAQAAGVSLPGSASTPSASAAPAQQAAQSSPLRPDAVRPISPLAPENQSAAPAQPSPSAWDDIDPDYDPRPVRQFKVFDPADYKRK